MLAPGLFMASGVINRDIGERAPWRTCASPMKRKPTYREAALRFAGRHAPPGFDGVGASGLFGITFSQFQSTKALAAGWAGFTTVGFAEIDSYASVVLKKHWSDVPNLSDVRNVTGERFPTG